MGSIKALTLSVAFLGSIVTGAFAADMPAPPGLMPAPALAAPAAMDTSGWYLRGDVGVGVSGKPTYSTDWLSAQTNGAFVNPDLGDSMHIGGGAGYAFNNWFRSDVTLEYRGKSAISTTSTRQYVDLCACTHTVKDQWQGNISSTVGLVNAYADLGTWNSITPYIGVGVGVSRNSVTGAQYAGIDTSPAPSADYSANTFANKTRTSFAWALMTGLSYDVSANTKLEFGYRYMNLGKAQSGTAPACCAVETPLKVKSLTSHDFHIGMRWMLGSPVAYAPQEQPLYRKF